MRSPLGQPLPHESAWLHVSGEARFVDDLPEPPDLLHAAVLLSPHAHARILARDASAALDLPEVVAVAFAADVPGVNDVGPIRADEPILAAEEVACVGQVVAAIYAETREAARAGLARIRVAYAPLPAVLTIEEAVSRGSFLGDPHVIARGDADRAVSGAPVRLEGCLDTPAQEHFYLETHAALAVPGEGGTLDVASSTQHPSDVQAFVARMLGWGRNRVVVTSPRMGGAFGGKETQAAQWACIAALGVHLTGRPVKLRLDRDTDMAATGHRHPFHTRWAAGVDPEGRILGFQADVWADAGFATDLSPSILARALFHLDNAYFLPEVRIRGRLVRTHRVSNTAFRGFGAPQGMIVIEHVMERIAAAVGRDPLEVRRINLYGPAPRHTAPYGQEVAGFRIPRMLDEVTARADLDARRARVAAFNEGSAWIKRGIACTPVKFGVSFTTAHLNQAGAYVVAYGDGTVQLNHGGTEMGQGLYTKMLQVCAHDLGVPIGAIRAMPTATDKVPNTSPTAASAGADLNGQAVRVACRALVERLLPVAADVIGVEPSVLEMASGRRGEWPSTPEGEPAWAWTPDGRAVSFRRVCAEAVTRRVPLAATGHYATPGIWYDLAAGRGQPFHYFAHGVGVSEVELNGLTGESRVLRLDILHDVGETLSPDVDRGQIEGGWVQGLGWLTCEEVVLAPDGGRLTRGPGTYKIPAVGDVPLDLRIQLLENAREDGVIHGSKAVGEPPLCLAIGTWIALCHAASAFGPPGTSLTVALPATPEALLEAVERARALRGPSPAE